MLELHGHLPVGTRPLPALPTPPTELREAPATTGVAPRFVTGQAWYAELGYAVIRLSAEATAALAGPRPTNAPDVAGDVRLAAALVHGATAAYQTLMSAGD